MSLYRLISIRLKKPAVFYLNFELYLLEFDNKIINKFYASLKDRLKTSHQDFYYFDQFSKNNSTIVHNGVNMDYIQALFLKNDPINQGRIRSSDELLNFEKFLKDSYASIFKYDFDLTHNLLESINIVFLSAKIWEKIFRRYQPKLIFTVCYYIPQNLGMIWAAKKFKIPTLEIQHGNQINYPPYCFSNLPTYGYNSLPSHFLTWDMPSFKFLKNWVGKNNSIQIILLGNPWIDYFKNSRYSLNSLTNRIKENKPTILYSLVPEHEVLPVFMLELINRTISDYNWLVRLHPRQETKIKEVESLFEHNNLQHVNVREATTFPLPLILKYSNLHITSWSSIVLEASAFGLKSLVFHKEGVSRYRSLNNAIPIEPEMSVNFIISVIEENLLYIDIKEQSETNSQLKEIENLLL